MLACVLAAFALGVLAPSALASSDDTTPPTQPLDVTVVSTSHSSITVIWRPSIDDVGVIGYGIYVNLVRVDRVLVDSDVLRQYTFTDLVCGTTYNLAFDAYDAAGNRSHPVRLVASTPVCAAPAAAPAVSGDRESPSLPTGLTATAANHTSVSLSWRGSNDNVAVAGYGIYANGTLVATSPGTEFTLSALPCGTAYGFAVDAYDPSGNRSPRASVTASTAPCQSGSVAPPPIATPPAPPPPADTRHTSGMPADALPPSTPLALGVARADATSVSLVWSEATDNVGVAGYAVDANGTRVGSTNSTAFTVFGLTCATTYTFSVDAFDFAGNESAPVSVSGATSPCPSTGATNAALFVAPATASGSDANTCSKVAPCLTFARAYQLASPGQTVEIAAGSYPSQLIPRDDSKGTGRVTFEPAPGASVSVSLIDFGQDQFGIAGPSGVVVRNMAVTYLRAWNGSNDLVWENVSGRHFDVFNSSNVSVLGGSYGPCQAPRDDPSCVIRIAASSNVLVSGASIHGITSTDLVNYHVDGMFIRGGNGVVVRKSKFWGNMITNIRVQDQPCCIDRNITLENNWFEAPLQGDGSSRRFDAVDVDNPVSGLVIRNNSFAEDAGLQLTGNFSSTRIVGNVMRNNGDCVPGATYQDNVYIPFSSYTSQGPCGSGDKKVTSFGYENAGGFDFHLDGSSPAIGAGNPSDCPADDIDGDSRSGGRCDAGADQR